MVDIKVKYSAEEKLRTDRHDKPMCWAIHQDTSAVVHVSMLSRSQTGLHCKCVCPGCNSTLQAVNAGRDAEYFLKPGVRGQFFRHTAGNQHDSCLFSTANLVALKLLVEQNIIELPPPKACGKFEGASEFVYQSDFIFGTPIRAGIVAKRWMDEQAAVITLDDGRVVLLKLSGRRSVGLDGNFDGVVTIDVNNPDVASWSPERILSHAKLVDGFLCWDKHWDDSVLSLEAASEAREMAEQAYDILPEELAWLADFPSVKKSEGIAHWLVKNILLQEKAIKLPSCFEWVDMAMPDGEKRSASVEVRFGQVCLDNVRLEFFLDGVIPDVFCSVVDKKGGTPSFDLMIEVAVSHYVDEVKRKKIEKMNVACLEIEVGSLGAGQKINFDALREEICFGSKGKRWIYHPLIQDAKARAKDRLLSQAARINELELEKDRESMLISGLSERVLLDIYLRVINCYWLYQRPVSLHGVLWSPSAASDVLEGRGWAGAGDQILLAENGLIYGLDKFRVAGRLGRHEDLRDAYACFSMAQASPVRSRYITLLAIAYRTYCPVFDDEKTRILKLSLKKIKESILSGKSEFVRPTKHDRLVGAIFPEMEGFLKLKFGTIDYPEEDRCRKYEESQRLSGQVENQRIVEVLEERERVIREQVEVAIGNASVKGWAMKLGFTATLSQVLSLAEVRSLSGVGGFRKFDVPEVVRTAWIAREQGIDIAIWLADKNPLDANEVNFLLKVLKVAWLFDC